MQTLPFGLTTASKHTFNRPLLWAPSTLFPFLRTADIMPRAQITWPSSQQVPRALHTCSASPVFVRHVLRGLFQLLLDCCSEAWKNRDFKPTRSGRDEIAWSQNIFFFFLSLVMTGLQRIWSSMASSSGLFSGSDSRRDRKHRSRMSTDIVE